MIPSPPSRDAEKYLLPGTETLSFPLTFLCHCPYKTLAHTFDKTYTPKRPGKKDLCFWLKGSTKKSDKIFLFLRLAARWDRLLPGTAGTRGTRILLPCPHEMEMTKKRGQWNESNELKWYTGMSQERHDLMKITFPQGKRKSRKSKRPSSTCQYKYIGYILFL